MSNFQIIQDKFNLGELYDLNIVITKEIYT